jgi:outer membrane protein assembly factor BamC
MTIQRIPVFLAALLIFNLGGCALFGDKPENSPAKLREALEVPPDLARPAGDDLAAVPSSGVAALSDYTAKNPATSAGSAGPASTTGKPAAPASGGARLERDGAQRWLVVQDTAEHVFVKARDYFLRDKTSLTTDNPTTGVLETDWIDRPVKFTGTFSKILASLQSTGLRDKFRVRVEAGRVPGTAELYVSHQGLVEVVASEGGDRVTRTVWQPAPADPEVAAEMLGKIQAHFGGDSQQPKGQTATAETDRAQQVKGEVVLPQDDMDAAWRRVGQALDRAGVITEDRDRSAGIFYVRYVDSSQANKRQGVFSWLLGDPDKVSAAPDAAKGEVLSDRFQVRLKTTPAGTSVNVFNVKGEPDKTSAGGQLLGVLQQQLR